MKSLVEIYKKWQFGKDDGHGDKGTIHSYIEIYDILLAPYRNNTSILEIGVAYGESLELWNEYFVNSKIYGIDIISHQIQPYINDPRFNIIIGDATKIESYNYYLNNNIKFNVIIDDGSHMLSDQICTYNMYKNLLHPNGIYIMEDVLKIDETANTFLSLDNQKNIEIYDLRCIKRRHDDVLIVITDKTN